MFRVAKRRLHCSLITVFKNFQRQKIVASKGLLNLVKKSIRITNGWKLNLDKFKFKIRHMFPTVTVIEYWNKWPEKGLNLHFLMSLNQACLSLQKTCLSKNHKLCFCQSQVAGLHPEVKGKFMTSDLDGVREDNLMSFLVLPSMNLSISTEWGQRKNFRSDFCHLDNKAICSRL